MDCVGAKKIGLRRGDLGLDKLYFAGFAAVVKGAAERARGSGFRRKKQGAESER
jgi:hypothetical protein